MSILIQKFGGTSLGTLARIQQVASNVKESSFNNKIVVVVSAMAGETNQLVNLVGSIDANVLDENYDLIISSAEQVSAGLLSICLSKLGLKTRTYLGWQVPVITDDNFSDAEILQVKSENLLSDVRNGVIPIVCGFQGVTHNNKVTTIGRGGSDLTAVAIADALGAICEIYTDVQGVYSIDPNISSKSHIIQEIDYKYMLEMAINGAQILQDKSVEMAMKKKVPIKVASTFSQQQGTIVKDSHFVNGILSASIIHNLVQYDLISHASEIKKILYDNNIIYDIIDFEKNKYGIDDASLYSTIVFDKNHLKLVMKLLKKFNIENSIQIKSPQIPLSRFVFFGDMNKEIINEIINSMLMNNIEYLSKDTKSSYENKNFACKLGFVINSCDFHKLLDIFNKMCS